MSNEGRERAWVEIDSGALCANYRSLAARLPEGCEVLPMVKADGYGLGARWVVESLAGESPWGFGVATAEEGTRLRRIGWAGRLTVFSPALPGEAARLLSERLEPALAGMEAAECLAEQGHEVRFVPAVHVEIDTGMGRLGFGWAKSAHWVPRLAQLVNRGDLVVAGTFTHFHSAAMDEKATREQWTCFQEAVEAMKRGGVSPGLLHTANSAAALLYPEWSPDLVRPGLYLYGGHVGVEGFPTPHRVVAVRARVSCVRSVEAGQSVSYGATYRTPKPARLATVGIGYGDGLPWRWGGRGRVLIHGEAAPIRGAVCMDSTVVDVTHVADVGVGDVVTVIGVDGTREIGLEEMAAACGTIPYEILTSWSSRLPRLEANSSE